MKNKKHVFLVTDVEHTIGCGGFMGFYVDMDTVEMVPDKETGSFCFVAYAKNRDEFWWIASTTPDMENCYKLSREGNEIIVKCNSYGKPMHRIA